MSTTAAADQRFVVLLRGVNVGGKNKLPMAELRAALEAAGFDDVTTYIQSGNVALRAPSCTGAEIRTVIANRFDLDIPAVVLTAEQLQGTVANNPEPDLAEENPKFLHVYFCEDPISAAAVSAIGALDQDRFLPDRLSISAGNVYAAYPNGVAKSKLTIAVVDRALGQATTARNWNTVLKLLEMAQA